MGKTKNKENGAKRLLSDDSPGGVSDLTPKRPNVETSHMMNQYAACNTPHTGHQQHIISPYPSTPSGYYTPPIYAAQAPTQVPTQSHVPKDNSFQTLILDKLAAIDHRLSKLDSIEKQVSEVSQKMTSLDTRITFLEKASRDTKSKLNDIESSRQNDSDVCQDILSKQTEINKSLIDQNKRLSDMSYECDRLRYVNNELETGLLDLQSRSMRDNLMFYGFEELPSADDRRQEDCRGTVIKFCDDKLSISDVNKLVINRAHRIGAYTHGKTRPIVVNFSHTPDKMLVKKRAYEVRDPQIRVGDQFPKVIQNRRKQLIPVLGRAKADGKTARLAHDKLYINGRMYTVDTVSTSGYGD